MTRSILDFNGNNPVKINGKVEKYDVTIEPNTTDDLTAVIENIIVDFELLQQTIMEDGNAKELVQRNDKLYTFQVTRNLYPEFDFNNKLSLISSPILYFNFHRVLFVFEDGKDFNIRLIYHNGKIAFDPKSVKDTIYNKDHYESKLFRLIELIEDIFDTTIDRLSNGIISP